MSINSIHIRYSQDTENPWVITMVQPHKDVSLYTGLPEQCEEILKEMEYGESSDRHIRLMIQLSHILKYIVNGKVESIQARYYLGALPVVLFTIELKNGGSVEMTLNLYSHKGKLELISTRGLRILDQFEREVKVEFKPVQNEIFKPAPRYFYDIDISKLDSLPVLVDNPGLLSMIKELIQMAQVISDEVLA